MLMLPNAISSNTTAEQLTEIVAIDAANTQQDNKTMTTALVADIIPPLEPIHVRVRRALDEWHSAEAQWVQKTLALALELKAARDECASDDTAFGNWLIENDCNRLGEWDRAALIKFAENIDLAREVLQVTTRRSVQHIWKKELKPRLASVHVNKGDETRRNKRSSFCGWERAEEVYAIYQVSTTRGEPSGGDLWPMILMAIDEGFLTMNNYNLCQGVRPSLRILFPDERAKQYCKAIDLSTSEARQRVRDVIMPAMVADKAAILADPAQIAHIMKRASASANAVAQLTALPEHQCEVVVYGKQFWPNPNPDLHTYTYDQCRAAFWYFQETNQLFQGMEDHEGRATNMRSSTRWFTQYADREMHGEERDKIKMVFQLIHAMANAMQENPTATSSTVPLPTTDNEWP